MWEHDFSLIDRIRAVEKAKAIARRAAWLEFSGLAGFILLLALIPGVIGFALAMNY
jgi:UDP-N-acetylenolpyruvoylglucosamine reductase